MKKRTTPLPIISFLFIICIILFILAQQGIFQSVPFINTVFAPLQRITLMGGRKILSRSESSLEKENQDLIKKLVDYAALQRDNAALNDQFHTTTTASQKLLSAHIIGEPGFIPGTNAINALIIDKGSAEGIKMGMIVIYKDNLIGQITQINSHFSQVIVLSNQTTSFSGETLNGQAKGVVKGQGDGSLILDNVVLNQTLKRNDLVVTAGDIDIHGNGYPPGLVVGKIASIEKDPSALFQKADLDPLIDITKLEMVFVIVNQ